jgi:hypothetical protein
MVHPARHDVPVYQLRRFLETGTVVPVSSHHGGQGNVMTLGGHMVLELMISAKSRPMRMTRLD